MTSSTPQTAADMPIQHRNLVQQGYKDYTSAQLKQIDMGLRFTPAVCSAIAVYGLIIQSPALLFFVAMLGMWAFFFPSGHPMDLLYNKIICPLIKAEPLPANPLQRRLACFAAGMMNTAAAIFFLVGLPMAAYITGGLLMILQAIVIFTHFCTLSWIYEKVLNLIGQWERPIAIEEAKKLLANGATLVDVRGPDEFAAGHLDNAINLPLDIISSQADSLRDQCVMVYCASGMRSQMAKKQLVDGGLLQVYDLGGKNRASAIFG